MITNNISDSIPVNDNHKKLSLSTNDIDCRSSDDNISSNVDISTSDISTDTSTTKIGRSLYFFARTEREKERWFYR
jgi:hypothetical protein